MASQTLGRPPVPSIVFLAGADGEGHAQVTGDSKTLCGRPALTLRYAHPERTRHDECSRLVEVRKP